MIDISVNQVSKAYRLPLQSGPSSGSPLRRWSRKQTFWALRDVSFDVARGEAVGIVGPNGSGKTTLIKLLSSITAPTAGEITLRGRLSSLVEVGAGFHPDLTGRENIFLNGAILGMRRHEIARKIDSIIEFSGLGDFIGVPVKRYSSGMFVRLGFAVAVHLDAEILLLDEVLAVGDAAFQTRCFDRVDEVRKAGRTVVLVSHDLAAVERICDRALLLRSGEVAMCGSPTTVVEAYQTLAYEALPPSDPMAGSRGPVSCKALTFAGPGGGPARTGAPLVCRLTYEALEVVDQAVCTVSLMWPSGYLCTQLTASGLRLERGTGEIEFTCPMLTMQRGLYTVDVVFERLGHVLDQRQRCALLRVDPGRIVAGDFYLEHSSQLRQRLPAD